MEYVDPSMGAFVRSPLYEVIDVFSTFYFYLFGYIITAGKLYDIGWRGR